MDIKNIADMNHNKILIIIVTVLIIIFVIAVYLSATAKTYFKDGNNTSKINNFLGGYCEDKAVFDSKDFPWSKGFRNNWKAIKDEYIIYSDKYMVPDFKSISESTSSCNVNNGWKTLFLRAYGVDTEITHMFPKTMELINKCPCTLAFFSVFEPGTKLLPHVGVFKGVLRYHLPLIVPDDWDKCFINVNGHKLHWRLNEDLMFDDMYIHYAENNTNQRRVVLFLDIKRDFKNPFINGLNSLLLKSVKSNDAVKDTVRKANSNNFKQKSSGK